MIEDIRLDLNFRNSRKKKRLHKKLGAEGVMSLIILWLSVAENKPKGVLCGYDISDIELDAEWDGKEGLFVETLLEPKSKFLDFENGVYSLHNWKERQPWVYNSNERGDKARFCRLAKVNRSEYERLKKEGINAISKEKYTEIATNIKRHVDDIETNPEQKVDETLTNSREEVDVPLTPAPVPVPVPVPSPIETLKDIPDSSESGKQEEEFYLSKKKRKLTGKRLETFKEFWEVFNYRKDKASAADSWLDIQDLTNNLFSDILKAAKIEADGRQALIDKNSTPKYAQGWITSRRWEDENKPQKTSSQNGNFSQSSSHVDKIAQRMVDEENKRINKKNSDKENSKTGNSLNNIGKSMDDIMGNALKKANVTVERS